MPGDSGSSPNTGSISKLLLDPGDFHSNPSGLLSVNKSEKVLWTIAKILLLLDGGGQVMLYTHFSVSKVYSNVFWWVLIFIYKVCKKYFGFRFLIHCYGPFGKKVFQLYQFDKIKNMLKIVDTNEKGLDVFHSVIFNESCLKRASFLWAFAVVLEQQEKPREKDALYWKVFNLLPVVLYQMKIHYSDLTK